MKKTLTLLFAFVAFAAFAAPGGASAGKPTAEPFDPNKIYMDAQMGDPIEMGDIQQAPEGLQAIMIERWAQKLKATPNFPATTVDDLVGGYDFVYRQYTGGFTTQPDTISNNYTFQRDTVDNIDVLGINKVADDSVRITGMFLFPVGAKMGTSGNYTTLTLDDTHPVYYHSTYGACNLRGVWYYEGDETYSAGWYIGDVMGYLLEQGILFEPDVHFYMVIASGSYAGYRLGWIYEPSSYMVPDTDYNGLMTFNYTSNQATNAGLTPTYDYPVILTEDENYVVTVENFAGVATNPVTINLEEGRTWTADNDIVLYSNNNYNYVLYGLDGNTAIDLIGTGTEKVLTFGSEWTGWDRDAGYWIGRRSATTITLISDDEFVYPGEEPTGMTEFYLVGTFNNWSQENGMLAFTGNEAGDEYTITTELETGAEFKVITPDGDGWKWFGGQDDNSVGYFLITNDIEEVALVDGANLKVEEGGEYTFTIKEAVAAPVGKAVNEPLVMTVSKTSTAIETITTNNVDNNWYNLQGQKFNGMPSVPGIYINNGKKVIVK
ncbi:MAG: hypothetical protein J5629_01310 [Muribaculaceae bacterium]|nr:hypothetical protein [Muribaculaceae bacterium]